MARAFATIGLRMVARMRERQRGRVPRLSVIVAVRDDEDSVGRDVRALAGHLRKRGADPSRFWPSVTARTTPA